MFTPVSTGLGFFSIPLLSNLTRRVKMDRFIGDISYPMYLTHICCKWVILATMGVVRKDDSVEVPGWELLALTVVASVALVWLVDYPVDRWRQARVAKAVGARHAPEGRWCYGRRDRRGCVTASARR